MKSILLAALLAVVSTSCLSTPVRDNTLVPAMELAWVGVRADLERGLADAVEDGDLADRSSLDSLVADLEAALADGGERSALRRIPWASMLLPYAERGIQDRVDDGEMSDQVAESLRERLRNFSTGFEQLIAVTYRRPRESWLSNGSQVTPTGTVTLAGKLVPTFTTVD